MAMEGSFFEELEDNNPTPGERRPHGEHNNGPPAEKARPGNKKYKAREGTVNWTKKRARDIERRLQRDQDLPADVQKDLERELSAHQKRLGDEQDKKQRNMMIKKYHMVRFFERKKAQRLEKQLQSQLEKATDPEEISTLQTDIHTAQVDVQYTKYFPFMERYVSLYTEAAGPKADDTARAKVALRSPRPPLWSTVEKTMAKGQDALRKLQNRRLGTDSRAKPPPERPSRHAFAARARGIQSRQKPVAVGGKDAPAKEPGRRRDDPASPA